VDADIKGFFDHIDHEWMMRFLKWHIKDPNILWLVQKYLKAGVMVDEKYEDTDEGTIQGGNISPTLANIYMHNVLTLWFKLVIQKEAKGECFLVNYADDFVAGFQYKSDAEHYYAALKERMAKFNLELEESKSRLRIRAICGAKPQSRRAWEARDVRLSWVHILLWQEQERLPMA